MSILALGRHFLYSRPNGSGGTRYFYYYDEITWVVGALALAWLAWLFVRRRLRLRSLKRAPRRTDRRLLKRIVRLKRELSSAYLGPGFSRNIHAVGIGMLGGEYCIQVFVNDANDEMWEGAGAATPPDRYGGVRVVLVEAPGAILLSGDGSGSAAAGGEPREGMRGRQEVLVGGISGANTNLTGECGTIGYFCTRRSRLPGRKAPHIISNRHVFADVGRDGVDDGDLIVQPSPGEPSSNRPVGTLVKFSPLKFGGDPGEPNHVDAAVARLWESHHYKPVLPFIGALKGFVDKKDVEIGEAVRKVGRTTGYTVGRVSSIYLDIRVGYDRTGQSAFFRDQILIEPASPPYTPFVDKGDSGSFVVDGGQYAVGLIFAGAGASPEAQRGAPDADEAVQTAPAAGVQLRVEGYGVANPISEVLDRLKVELTI